MLATIPRAGTRGTQGTRKGRSMSGKRRRWTIKAAFTKQSARRRTRFAKCASDSRGSHRAKTPIAPPTASRATKGVCVRALMRPKTRGRWRSSLIASVTRDPARIEAFDAEIIEKIAPPTITAPPIGPRKARAATPIADSVYSFRSATTTTSTTAA